MSKPKESSVRVQWVMFWVMVVFVVTGLSYFIALGLMHR